IIAKGAIGRNGIGKVVAVLILITMSIMQTGIQSDETQRVARNIRRRVLDYVIRHNGGYLSQACSGAEILATLYTRVMNLGPSLAPMIPLPFPGVPSAQNTDFFNGSLYNGAHEPHLDRFFFSP